LGQRASLPPYSGHACHAGAARTDGRHKVRVGVDPLVVLGLHPVENDGKETGQSAHP